MIGNLQKLPNIISLARLLTVPFFIYAFLQRDYETAFFIFLLSAFSDALDGYLARRFKLATSIGTYLDPLADKILVVCTFILFGLSGLIPLYLVGLTVLRDLLLLLGIILLKRKSLPVKIAPLFISKVNTVLQLCLILWFLGTLYFDMTLPIITELLIYTVTFTTLLSMIGYIKLWIKLIKNDG